MMITSILNFHEWKSVGNFWLPTKGRVPNTCVRGFGNQTMSLEIGIGSEPMACLGCAKLTLMIPIKVELG